MQKTKTNYLLYNKQGGLENFKNKSDALKAKNSLKKIGLNTGIQKSSGTGRLGNTSVLISQIKKAVKKRR
jgi:hypothetical protein